MGSKERIPSRLVGAMGRAKTGSQLKSLFSQLSKLSETTVKILLKYTLTKSMKLNKSFKIKIFHQNISKSSNEPV